MTSTHNGLRNLAFLGQPAAEKTTLVDTLAHLCDFTARKGSVEQRTSSGDAKPEEQEKGHTLQAAFVQGEAHVCRWILIDTPGCDDFVADANGAIAAADVVVGVRGTVDLPNDDFQRELERARVRQGARDRGHALRRRQLGLRARRGRSRGRGGGPVQALRPSRRQRAGIRR